MPCGSVSQLRCVVFECECAFACACIAVRLCVSQKGFSDIHAGTENRTWNSWRVQRMDHAQFVLGSAF
jgi:hypothetical protein